MSGMSWCVGLRGLSGEEYGSKSILNCGRVEGGALVLLDGMRPAAEVEVLCLSRGAGAGDLHRGGLDGM
jgi:hypothetical protein